MDRIDILIPAAIGLLLATRPQLFVKAGGAAAQDPGKLRRLRLIGAALLSVALLYTAIRILSPR